MDRFFGYQFSTYGTDVLRISELPIEERVDPMSKVFPKVRFVAMRSLKPFESDLILFKYETKSVIHILLN